MDKDTINDDFEITFISNRKLMIPRSLGQYQLQKKIIEVRNCVVLQSINPQNGQKLAIKCIPINFFHLNSNEVEIMNIIDNEHVMKSLDSFYYPPSNPRFYAIVMPRAMSDLLDYINYHQVLPERIVYRIMKDSLEALDFIHSNQVWHRDLKLDNIFVLKEEKDGPSVAIADFGLAGYITADTITGQAAGTIEYSAPELLDLTNHGLQFKKNATYSNKVDTWSMGIIMFALLCGKLPFDRYSIQDAQRLLNGEVIFEPLTDDPNDPFLNFLNVSEEAKDLILCLLCLDPEQRYTANKALEHMWFQMFQNVSDEIQKENDDIFSALGNEDDEIKF